MSIDPKIVFFKIETTGPDPKTSQVIEFAGVCYNLNRRDIDDKLDVLIEFDPYKCPSPPGWRNNFTLERWKDAIPETDALMEIDRFLKHSASIERTSERTGKLFRTARMAGHGASKFDFPHLRRWFDRHERFFPADMLCLDTVQLSAFTNPELAATKGYDTLKFLDPTDRSFSSAMSHAMAGLTFARSFWGGLA